MQARSFSARSRCIASQPIDLANTRVNDHAAISGEANGTLIEGVTINRVGEILILIAPNNAMAQSADVEAAAPSGAHGSFIFNVAPGAWTYTLPEKDFGVLSVGGV